MNVYEIGFLNGEPFDIKQEYKEYCQQKWVEKFCDSVDLPKEDLPLSIYNLIGLSLGEVKNFMKAIKERGNLDKIKEQKSIEYAKRKFLKGCISF